MPTVAKKRLGVRLTRSIKGNHTKRSKGRPKGTYKKRKFEETRLGFLLKYETPIEYLVIMSGGKIHAMFPEPDIVLIEAVVSMSDDPSFQKRKFKEYLEEYRECGIYVNRAKVMTPELERYYKVLRKNKTKEFYKDIKRKR